MEENIINKHIEKLVDIFFEKQDDSIAFERCRKMISEADNEIQDKLQNSYCNLLLDNCVLGYYVYNKTIGEHLPKEKSIRNNPYFLEFKKEVKKVDTSDLENKIFLAIIDLVEGKNSTVLKNLSQWIKVKIEHAKKENTLLECDDIVYSLIIPLKEGFPGMWSEISEMLTGDYVEKGVNSLCLALEKLYYSSDNNEIIEELTKVINENKNIYVAKELLAFTYYDMCMWNNALAVFEQLEDDFPEREYGTEIFLPDTKFFWMAWCYGKKKDYAKEEKYYRKSLKLYPDREYTLNNLGYSLYKQKKYAEAKKVFKKCIREEKDLRYASNNLVRTLLATGEFEEAKAFIQKSKVKIIKELIARVEKGAIPKSKKEDSGENTELNRTVNLGVKKQQFSSEKILEDELVLRMESGIPVFGLPLKVYQKRGVYGRQYMIPNGRLDILAVDEKNNFYVIELKKDSGYDDAYTQTVNYIEWIQKNLAKGSQKVYGIICLNNPTQELIEKVKNNKQIKLFEYSISYSEIT